MKNLKKILYAVLEILALIGLIAGLVFAFQFARANFLPLSGSGENSQAAYPPPGATQPYTPIPAIAPTPTLTPTPFPPINWSPAPPCKNQPINAEKWVDVLKQLPKSQIDAYLIQMGSFSNEANDLNIERLVALLGKSLPDSDTEQAQRDSIVLLLNLVSGRVNLDTQVSLSDLPNVKNIRDLISELEKVAAGVSSANTPGEASREIANGQNITRSVCARLAYLHNSNNLLEAMWGDNGVETFALLPPEARKPIKANLDYFIASPDGNRIALSSSINETGGPMFLLNLRSQELPNVIQQLAPNVSGKDISLPNDISWSFIGWHPNSTYFLAGPGDAGYVYWIDLIGNTANVIPLDTGGNGGSVFIDLSPKGTHFAYVAADYSTNMQRLNLYDLESGKIYTLLEQSFADGVLNYPRFSPDGTRIAYLVQIGHPTTGVLSAIHIIDISSKVTSLLVKASLVTAEPVWSPDGNWIAFTKNEPDEPIVVTPNDIPMFRQGNIWIGSVDGKNVQQITFVVGRASQPSWSIDSQTLSFISHDGQIGMVNINQPGKIWQIAGPMQSWTNFISASFMP